MLKRAHKTSQLGRNAEYFDEKRCVICAEKDKLRAKLTTYAIKANNLMKFLIYRRL